MSGEVEFYLFENVLPPHTLFLILAYPQNMGRKAVCLE